MNNLTFNFIMIVLLVILIIIYYYKLCFNFWKSRNVPYPTPTMPLGNVPFSALKLSMYEQLKLNYDIMKDKCHKHFGYFVFSKPVYVPVEPEYIKAVLTKDFVHFYDRGIYHNERDDPLSCNLLQIEGEKWRKLRTKFTPTFSPSKIKMMFRNMMSCAEAMLEAVDHSSDEAIDIKEMSACFTTDVIGSCVFGIDCRSFDENSAEFRKQGRQLFKVSAWFLFKVMITSTLPDLARALRITIINKEASKFFLKVIENTMKYREEHGIVRNDFLQLLMELRRNHHDGLSLEEATAQSFVFFSAGFETSSTTVTFGIYELAQRQDIQDKLREEIQMALEQNDDILTYESIMEMKYLNQVVDEILRKHPPVPTIPRICTKNYKFPDGKSYIEKGTHAFVPVFALHRDPEHYPDPEKFDPDRFTDENKAKRHPYAFLPFGEGPRVCIGQKFGLLQAKIGLVTLLRNYNFSLNQSWNRKLKYDNNTALLTSKYPIWVNVEKISN